MAVQINKGILLDVFDIYCRDLETGAFIFMSENLTSSSITGSTEKTEVRNGRGNALFASLYSNKSITAEIATNVFDLGQISMMSASKISNNTAGITYSAPQTIACTVAGKITLSETPLHSDKVEIFKDGVKITATIAELVATIADAKLGDTFKVLPYEIEFEAGDYDVIDIKADEFPSACELIFKGVERDKNSKVIAELTIILPRCSPSTDFSLSTASTGEPTDQTITFEALSEYGSLAKIHRKEVTSK